MRKLVLEDEIKAKILSIQSTYAFKRELGGILVGLYDADLGCLRLTDMSFPHTGDQQSRFRFFRKSDGHQELMDHLWEESEHTKAYLGEWHTHDQDTPIPSMKDRGTWKRISKRNNNFDECYFMIIGRKEYVVWTVSEEKIIEVIRGGNNGECE